MGPPGDSGLLCSSGRSAKTDPALQSAAQAPQHRARGGERNAAHRAAHDRLRGLTRDRPNQAAQGVARLPSRRRYRLHRRCLLRLLLPRRWCGRWRARLLHYLCHRGGGAHTHRRQPRLPARGEPRPGAGGAGRRAVEAPPPTLQFACRPRPDTRASLWRRTHATWLARCKCFGRTPRPPGASIGWGSTDR